MVGVRVGEDDGVDPAQVVPQGLGAEVGAEFAIEQGEEQAECAAVGGEEWVELLGIASEESLEGFVFGLALGDGGGGEPIG